jgi:hypothetical protein
VQISPGQLKWTDQWSPWPYIVGVTCKTNTCGGHQGVYSCQRCWVCVQKTLTLTSFWIKYMNIQIRCTTTNNKNISKKLFIITSLESFLIFHLPKTKLYFHGDLESYRLLNYGWPSLYDSLTNCPNHNII